MSLLTIIQNACDEIGISKPTAVVGNTNAKIVQLLALANREGKALAARPYEGWQQLIEEATFTTVATASQGALSTLAPGQKYIINNTIWNRTTQRPVYGPLSPRDWQAIQASPAQGPFDQYRIQGDELLFEPVPTAGDSCAFEFMSKNFCESSGGTAQSSWQADTDVGRLDEELMTLGLIWRWKAAKGLDYGEDFQQYEIQVNDAIMRNATKETLNASGRKRDFTPMLVIPLTGYGP